AASSDPTIAARAIIGSRSRRLVRVMGGIPGLGRRNPSPVLQSMPANRWRQGQQRGGVRLIALHLTIRTHLTDTHQGYMMSDERDTPVRYMPRRRGVGDDGSKRIKTRMNRIAGQVAGIQRMLEEDRYCVDVLNQIAAVRSALDALGIELLTRHLESCVLGGGGGHAQARAMSQEELLAEVRTVLSRFLK